MTGIPATMTAVQLLGHGGYDMLEYREDVPVPSPGTGQVLINVTAAGVNNTDINTRIGWYSKTVSGSTDDTASEAGADEEDESSWATELKLPLIQGADVCGYIVAVGEGVSSTCIGERVIVEPVLREPVSWEPFRTFYLGAQCDGGFAQFVVTPSVHTYKVDCDWTDAELASLPCSCSTAENLLTRSSVSEGETVLVTGASGGVGSAAVQLAKRRGATVIGVSSPSKAEEVLSLGAHKIVPRGHNLARALGAGSVDVVIDIVGGDQWPQFLEVLKSGGRYAVSGAIAGPVVELDLRALYLKDLSFFGGTVIDEAVFGNLASYVEKNEIRPVVAATYPLSEIAQAQEDFLQKKHTGKLVLIPPELG